MNSLIKRKLTKKILKFIFISNLPAFLIFIVIIVAIASILSIVEYVEEIYNGILDFFGVNEYKNMDLLALREHFASGESNLRDLAEIQPPETLVRYIDLQLSSILFGSNMPQYIDKTTIANGVRTEDSIIFTDYTHQYQWDDVYNMIYEDEANNLLKGDRYLYFDPINGDPTESLEYAVNPLYAYSVPWQFMSALDFVKLNLAQTELSEDVKEFHRLLRPRFGLNYVTNVEYQDEPEFIITSDREVTIQEVRTEYEWYTADEIARGDYLTGKEKYSEEKGETVYQIEVYQSDESWTETAELSGPGHYVGAVKFYRGQYEFEIEYEEKVFSETTENIIEQSDDYSILRIENRNSIENVPVLKGYISKDEELKYLSNALLSTLESREDLQLFMEILSMYPYSEHLLVAVKKAIENSVLDIPEDYKEIIHTFVYPTLKRNSNRQSYYREDIVNLSKSLIGLDYFWGGKYNKIGFDPGWGKFKKVTSPGVSMSFGNFRSGLDCSGYVQWVYKNAGLDIESSTWSMIHGDSLEEITIDELRPGDLGFYHDYSNGESGNHVGIFLEKKDGHHLFANAGGSFPTFTPRHINGRVLIQSIEGGYDDLAPVKFKKFYRYTKEKLE